MVVLRNILISDYEPLIRAAYAEDLIYLERFNGSLDAATNDILTDILPGDVFFKIENQYGAYIGFLTFTPNGNGISFHIRKGPFRDVTYLNAFWNLVTVIFNNNLLTSVGPANLSELPDYLESKFTIKNQLQFHGKNFLLLEQPIL